MDCSATHRIRARYVLLHAKAHQVMYSPPSPSRQPASSDPRDKALGPEDTAAVIDNRLLREVIGKAKSDELTGGNGMYDVSQQKAKRSLLACYVGFECTFSRRLPMLT